MVNTLSICATFPPVLPMATPMIGLCVSKNSSYAYEMCQWILFSKKSKNVPQTSVTIFLSPNQAYVKVQFQYLF